MGIISALMFSEDMSEEDHAYAFPLDAKANEKVLTALFQFKFITYISDVAGYFGCSHEREKLLTIRNILTVLGAILFAVMSSIDAEFFSEHRLAFTVFKVFMILLLIPFGTDNNTGNRSWLEFPFLPFDVQPAEICKIGFVLIMLLMIRETKKTPKSTTDHMGKLACIFLKFFFISHRFIRSAA